jgi:hypothetical protein
MRMSLLLLAVLWMPSASLVAKVQIAQTKVAKTKRNWRAATPSELESALPARATVEKEHIETEMRTATGVIDSHGKVVAAIVLITAGYAANGKYSYYLLAQNPIRIGADIVLPSGTYAIGWTRSPDGLLVHIYDAETGVERGISTAHPVTQPLPIVSIKIWPPSERSVIQIGRFLLPYSLEE